MNLIVSLCSSAGGFAQSNSRRPLVSNLPIISATRPLNAVEAVITKVVCISPIFRPKPLPYFNERYWLVAKVDLSSSVLCLNHMQWIIHSPSYVVT